MKKVAVTQVNKNEFFLTKRTHNNLFFFMYLLIKRFQKKAHAEMSDVVLHNM